MTFKEEHHEKEVTGKQVGESSSILHNSVGIHFSSRDPMNSSSEEEEKDEREKPEQLIKLPREYVKKYNGVRQRKWGKWVAEVYDPKKKGRIWLGIFNTAIEAAFTYNKKVIEIRGVDAVTNILKPPPREINSMSPLPKEINFMNPSSSSLDDCRI